MCVWCGHVKRMFKKSMITRNVKNDDIVICGTLLMLG
jgi:Zn ribbon nucleic-acid-binding protein